MKTCAVASQYYQLLFHITSVYVVILWCQLLCHVSAKLEVSGRASNLLLDVFFYIEFEQDLVLYLVSIKNEYLRLSNYISLIRKVIETVFF